MTALLQTLTPYFAKGMTDKEIAREVRKPVGTIRMYRDSYEQELFKKIKPIDVKELQEVKEEIAAVDLLEGEKVIDEAIAELVNGIEIKNEDKPTKKEMAFNLYSQGLDNSEVMARTGLSYNSVATYRSQYNKSIKENNVEPVNLVGEDVFETGTISLTIGSSDYSITAYVDNDGCDWLSLGDLRRYVYGELDKDIKDLDINVKYIKTTKVQGTYVTLIDKYALPIIAKFTNDFKLSNSMMKVLQPTNDIFSKVASIINAFDAIEELTGSLDDIYEQIEAYDKVQCDLLHDIENNPYTDEELGRKAAAIRDLRRSRRVKKNELALIKSLKNSLYGYKIKSYMLSTTSNRLKVLSDDLQSKKYNPRVEDLTEKQKITVDEYIAN